MKTTKFTNKIKLGVVDRESIWLSPPSWDCGWYWGFGYLGNKNCHYHVDGLKKIETYNHETKSWNHKSVNLFDGFKEHFGESFIIKNDNDLWLLCELFQTFYTLKETAELLGRGGSHYTTNPLAELITNKDEVTRINETIMPALFDRIYDLLKKQTHENTNN
jgi:hypothetical protein